MLSWLWNAPKCMWKRILSRDRIRIFLEMPKNWWILFSVTFLFQKLGTWFSLKYPTFHASKYFENQKGKMGHFKISKIEKWGISTKTRWSIIKREKNQKWICSILGHFKEKCKCRHMTKSSFRAFHGTSRRKSLVISEFQSADWYLFETRKTLSNNIFR